ncbi:rhamnan synthesis F family protein [Microbacterium trichothecenolyticum]|uniref:rhamnan synthesis F family protein n=1 Tax=Microbacterium trichothecenolyticum TaxID=69370 RepID=UPI0035BE8A29
MTVGKPRPAEPLRGRPRRLVVFAIYDRDGRVDPFVTFSLEGLRPHADRILVVVNGLLQPEGRAALSAADEILVRDNSGFDIGAHRDALAHLGDAIGEFDEIVLTNDTWYGPINPWQPVLKTMNARPCHFWGLTDHARTTPNPITHRGVAPYHLQSYWIAVRREMFLSEDWVRYWRELGPLQSYNDAVLRHELRFTAHFTDRGWIAEAAFPCAERDTENPSLFEAEALVDDGCPALKRRPLFHWPPLLVSRGALGERTLAAAAAHGYPTELILRNLARTAPPGTVNADAGLVTALTGAVNAGGSVPHPRTLVSAHVEDSPDVRWILDRTASVGECDLVLTVADARSAEGLHHVIADQTDREVRIVTVPGAVSPDAAFYDGCREAMRSTQYDLVVRLAVPRDAASHPSRDATDPVGAKNTWLEVASLFDAEAGLGIVFPPVPHLGGDSFGRGWRGGKEDFASLARRVGIGVPLDDVTPLAPEGTTFVARPAALRLLVEHDWGAEGREDLDAPRLAAALARMPAYAAGEVGFYTRTVATGDYLATSLPLLEFEAEEMSATIPGEAYKKIDFLRHSGAVGSGSGRDLVRMYARLRHRWIVDVARRLADPRRVPGRWLASARSRER